MAALGVAGAMILKNKLGMELEPKQQQQQQQQKQHQQKWSHRSQINKSGVAIQKRPSKKRITPVTKTRGLLPFLLPLLGAICLRCSSR